MDIKFMSLDREEGQSQQGKAWVAYKIKGIKLSDGSPWTSGNIFDNKYSIDILASLRELSQGDKVGIELKQNGKFWNVAGVGPVKETSYPAPAAGGALASGGSTYKWNGRTGEAYDRSAAVYLAFDIIKSITTEANMHKKNEEVVLIELFSLADDLFEYINAGNNKAGRVSTAGDALDAPEV